MRPPRQRGWGPLRRGKNVTVLEVSLGNRYLCTAVVAAHAAKAHKLAMPCHSLELLSHRVLTAALVIEEDASRDVSGKQSRLPVDEVLSHKYQPRPRAEPCTVFGLCGSPCMNRLLRKQLWNFCMAISAQTLVR